ncbi:uncharacterized protein LOC118435479 [Folsomia candida]|nr:uncharacterized protein LOC118435479 [Folsomia candida]
MSYYSYPPPTTYPGQEAAVNDSSNPPAAPYPAVMEGSYSYPPASYPGQNVAGGQVPIQPGFQQGVYPATSNMGFGQCPPVGGYVNAPHIRGPYVNAVGNPNYSGQKICLNVALVIIFISIIVGVIIGIGGGGGTRHSSTVIHTRHYRLRG